MTKIISDRKSLKHAFSFYQLMNTSLLIKFNKSLPIDFSQTKQILIEKSLPNETISYQLNINRTKLWNFMSFRLSAQLVQVQFLSPNFFC